MDLKRLNLKYSLVNIGFMLLASGSLGFAYNFLAQSGFPDGTIGTTMSLVSLLGVFAGPAAADVVDRSDKIGQKAFIAGSMIVCAIFSALLLIVPSGSFLILPVVIIAFMCATLGMPLLNGMAFIYEKAGGYINYGLCRGLGSAAYAVGSSLVGRIWASLGRTTLPVWCIAGALLTLVAILAMPDAPKAPESADKRREDDEESISMVQFFGKYRDVTLVVLALTLMYFCHFLIQTYLAKIIGTFETQGIEAIQGRALFIQAMVELPTMFGFALIMKRLGIPKILCIASVVYSIKHVLIAFCGSVPMLYAAMVLQMFSYAAIIPATVYFSNEQVAEADRNKGQAVFAAASTAAMLLSSFIGGWLFQFLSARLVVGFGAVVSIAGTALMFYGIQRCSKKRANQGVAKVRLKK